MLKNSKKVIALIILAAFLVIPMDHNLSYAGTNFSSASNYTFGTKQEGIISQTNNANYYQFELPSSGEINIGLTAYIRELNISIYDINGIEVWSRNLYWNSTLEAIKYNNPFFLTGGVYYFCINQNSGYTGTYDFAISFTSSNESFNENNEVNNNSFDVANVVEYDKKYYGQIASNDTKDFYQITLKDSGTVDLLLNAKIRESYLSIFDSNGEEVWSNREYCNSTTNAIAFNRSFCLTSGTYYFCINMESGYTGNYNFELTYTSANESFPELIGDNTLDKAYEIQCNVSYQGQIAMNDPKDFYNFSLSSDTTVTFDFSGELREVKISIYESNGTPIWSNREYANSTTNEISSVREYALSKGTYYLCVEKEAGYDGNYTFGIIKPITKVKLNSMASKSSSVTANWSKISNCSGYQIQLSDDKSFKKLLRNDIVNNKTTTYKVSKLKKSKTYYARVRAYVVINDKTYWGSWSTNKSVKCK